ncbi:MAG: SDR family oxidoreductase [Corynebacterium sp.]|nr:SDR family oxidoreductase [Corynebacterium sp.]
MTRVLVTGARGGIGSAIVRTFTEANFEVIAIDREDLDLTDSVAVREYAQSLEPIDVLVNAAGVFHGGPAATVDEDAWDALFNVNAKAVYTLSRIIGEKMAENGGGAIVTVASNSAVIPRAQMVAYGASKAAASILTRSLGLELGPRGVRCNVVCPGTTRTPMIAGLGSEEGLIRGVPENFKTGIPLGKIGTPEDVAATVFFLAGPGAGHINCAEIVVDGGASA